MEEEEEVVEPAEVLLLSLAGVEEVEASGEAEAELADTAEAGGGGREIGRVGATAEGLMSTPLPLYLPISRHSHKKVPLPFPIRIGFGEY